ncbi:MAG: TIGR03084 family metal-binding protein [Acidimicrobiia bacterium]|nr:TIGR03084 family metal-binding protein [Acidimicrobiia bacterium]
MKGTPMHVSDILADLLAEQASLDEIVAGLDPEQWELATASPRWSVTDQIAHLSYFDRAAAIAIEDPDRFRTERDRLLAAAGGGNEAVDELTLSDVRAQSVGDRLTTWRSGRAALEQAAAGLADDARVPWYGPPMGAKSFLTARLMECWAHGQDIVDAVHAERLPTDRLRHIAQLGCITRGWTYINRGEVVPEDDVRVDLLGPSGAMWSWGSEDATNRVSGTALDFCLVTTQRRHVADTDLAAVGRHATDWLSKAQAFAGPPTNGPAGGPPD